MGAYSRLLGSTSVQPPPADTSEGSAPGPGANGPSLGRAVSNVGNRIQEMLDTAERVADEIRADAEAAAANYVHEQRREADRVVSDRARELIELTESLSMRAKQMEEEAGALVAALEDAMQRMARLAGGAEAPAAAPGREPLSTPASPVPPVPVAAAQSSAASEERIPEQAVLRATQMAVAGTERTEIERMLRVEFNIDDPAAVVDEMLRSERA